MSVFSPEDALLYLDEDLIVLNKPAGLPVHRGRGGGKTLEDYLETLRFGNPDVPAIAHRLDRDTSGCLVLGRHKDALRRIGNMFMEGKVVKSYWAIIEGEFALAPEGRIDIPLRKQSPLKHRWWMEAHPDGMVAVTDYQLLGKTDGLAWLQLYPRTGRTHQLRVHCQAIGCPIVGDRIYGVRREGNGPMMHLHARSISIWRYRQPSLEIIAPPPEHMMEKLRLCRM